MWLNAKSAAAYLAFDDCKEPAEAFRVWAKRHGIPSRRRGQRRLLYLKSDLDRAIANGPRRLAS